MRVILIELKTALNGFITLVEQSLHAVVIKSLENVEGDWTLFSNKIKREFSTKDADKMTRTNSGAWMMDGTKSLGPIELLKDFELKLKHLPTRDRNFVEFRRVKSFLEAAGPEMKKEINRALDLFNPGRDEDDT
jgi:hypothetical protein